MVALRSVGVRDQRYEVFAYPGLERHILTIPSTADAVQLKVPIMMRRFTLAAMAACLCAPALAASKPKTLAELFTPLSSGACIGIDQVRALGATVELTPEQFQFVRAFWMAIPPVSRELPPGDKAFLAKGPNGMAILGLLDDDGRVCAVFQATDWIEHIVDEVGRGETGKLGQAV